MATGIETPRDLPYELELLRRMGRVLVDGTPLHDLPLCGRYAFWHRFVQFVFSSDIRRFSVSRNFDVYRSEEGGHDRPRSLKGFLVGLLGLFVSFFAFSVSFVRKPSVVLFGIDRVSDKEFRTDFRTHALNQYLDGRRVPFVECLHTVFDRSFVKNLFIRRRLAFYLESADVLYALLKFLRLTEKPKKRTLSNVSGFSKEEERFARYVIQKYLGEEGSIRFRIRMLSFFLRVSATRAVFAIDDARHYQDIMLAADRVGVPSYAFQHGHITRYHVGWLKDETSPALSYIRPDYLVVWGDYWKAELARLGGIFPDSAIMIGTPERESLNLPKQGGSGISILIPHETDSPKGEVVKCIEEVLKASKDVTFTLKLRPDHPKNAQLALYPGFQWEGERTRVITDLHELESRPDGALGVYSTFLYNLVLEEVPVGILDVASDYGAGMIENGLAVKIPKTDALGAIRKLAHTPKEERIVRKNLLLGSPKPLTETLDEILKDCGILQSS